MVAKIPVSPCNVRAVRGPCESNRNSSQCGLQTPKDVGCTSGAVGGTSSAVGCLSGSCRVRVWFVCGMLSRGRGVLSSACQMLPGWSQVLWVPGDVERAWGAVLYWSGHARCCCMRIECCRVGLGCVRTMQSERSLWLCSEGEMPWPARFGVTELRSALCHSASALYGEGTCCTNCFT